MKKMRRLIPAIAMLLVSAVMLSTASFAWFTMSTTAKATGMSVSAVASSSLLIVDGNDTTANLTEKFLATNGVVTFKSTDVGSNLNPATHFNTNTHKGEITNAETKEQATLTAPEGLVYIKNPEVIDPATGNVKTGEIAVYEVAGTSYYHDYVVYLGTSGEVMTGALSATIDVDASKIANIHRAIAIDFWVATATFDATSNTTTTTAKEFKGTTWLQEGVNNTNLKTVALGNATIPVAIETDDNGVTAATGNYYVVTMRVYFDGAYQAGEDGAFVRDAYSNDTPFTGFNVKFDIGQ